MLGFMFKNKKKEEGTLHTVFDHDGNLLLVREEVYNFIENLKEEIYYLKNENTKLNKVIDELKPIRKCKYAIIGSSECKKCKYSITGSSHMFVGQIDPFLGCNRDIVCEHFDPLEEE